MAPPFIPVCAPLLAGNEKRYVNEALESGWISSSGPFVSRFEQAFADFCGCRHAIAVTNGTAALHLTLRALKIGAGDEVIIPDFTMIATAYAVAYCGARPVFIDADPTDWNIDVTAIEAKITKATKAIIAVHLFGLPCKMALIRDIAEQRGLAVVEDAAEAHGATIGDLRAGNLGDIGCFSFFGNKIATTGEGGMVTTNDNRLAERCRYLRNMAFPLRGERTYLHQEIGFNYRITNLTAAIGLAQVERLEEYIERRRDHAALYQTLLADIEEELIWQPEPEGVSHVQWMFSIVLRKGDADRRNRLMAALRERDIDTRRLFTPMHAQPCLAPIADCAGSYPVADRLSACGLYLPSGSDLTEREIVRVCDTLKKSLTLI